MSQNHSHRRLGVTGLLLTQMLSFGDTGVLDLFARFERAIYAGHAEPGLRPT